MILVILNYIVSIFIIALGISLLSGIFNISQIFEQAFGEDNAQIFGVMLILWGTFRLVMYHIRRKHYSNWGDRDE